MKYILILLVLFSCGENKLNQNTQEDSASVTEIYLDSTGVKYVKPKSKKPDTVDTAMSYLQCVFGYMAAQTSQDSIQIEILRRGFTKKRERLFYYYDSIRVYYAKEKNKYSK